FVRYHGFHTLWFEITLAHLSCFGIETERKSVQTRWTIIKYVHAISPRHNSYYLCDSPFRSCHRCYNGKLYCLHDHAKISRYERYYAIIYPYDGKKKLTNTKLKVIIPFCWILAFSLNVPIFLVMNFKNTLGDCEEDWPQEWMGKANSMMWLVTMTFLPMTLMTAAYSRIVCTLWFTQIDDDQLSHRQKFFILGFWVFSGIKNLPVFLVLDIDDGMAYNVVWLIVVAIIPLTVMVVSYTRVVYRL
ncbi:hypothetical protein pdam_00008761, partial [Pocillopora damicornis]